MKTASDTITNAVPATDATQAKNRPHTPGRSDGLGDRLLMFDASTATSLELLRFKTEFSDSLGFEVALRKRIDAMTNLRHPSIAIVRTVKWLGAGEGLALVSNHTAGRRLSEIVPDARGPQFALELIRQLAPALVTLQAAGPDLAHGLLTADRIIVTREGRLVIIEHVLGSAVESVKVPADRLRTDLGLAMPSGTEPVALDQRSDVVQLAFIALSLLLGRRLDAADYPANIPALLDELARTDPQASQRLKPWLERAMQIGPLVFGNAQEALDGFHELSVEPDRTADVTKAVEAIRRAAAAGRLPEPEQGPLASASQIVKMTGIGANKAAVPSPVAEVPTPAPTQTPAPSPAPPQRKSGRANPVFLAAAAMTLISVAEGGFIGYVLYAQSLTVPVPAVITLPAAASPAATAPSALALAPAALAPSPSSQQNDPAPPAAPPAETTAAKKAAAVDAAAAAATAGPRFGGVRVSSPFELQVYEAGKLVGSTSGPLAVLEGSHVLDFVNETLGYRTRETVDVKGGQMAALALAVPNGRVSINAVPWATVSIDGVSAGDTPLANLSIAIGQHEIVFKHPQLGEQKQTVTVKADGLTRVSAVLRGGQQ